MDMHYCDIFGDCYHCPAAFCPYEKLEPSWLDSATDGSMKGGDSYEDTHDDQELSEFLEEVALVADIDNAIKIAKYYHGAC